MTLLGWVAENWSLERVGIVVSLFYAGLGSSRAARAIRAEMNFKITEQHHKIWSEIRTSPEWLTLKDRTRDLAAHPLTDEEVLCVNFLINHLRSTFYAHRAGIYVQPAALKEDISDFLSYPAIRAAWDELKSNHDLKFVRFVQRNLHSI